MEILMQMHEINYEHKSLLSVADLFDWYDSPISGIAQLVDNEIFYFFETMAIYFNTGLKVYALVEVDLLWIDRFRSLPFNGNPILLNKEVKQFLEQSSDNKFLFKGKHIDGEEYELIKAPATEFLSFKSVEELDNGSDMERQKWFNFFA
jgi:hypothetical protein